MVATRISVLKRTPTDAWQHLKACIKADSAGYVRVSLVNQSGFPAYFDDMALRPVDPAIYQENHYDPWGLNLVGIQHAGTPDSRFQYNGKEKQGDFGLNWIDYGARMYDSQLGRWTAVDPLAEKYNYISPYVYGNDNPVRYSDKDGREIVDSKGKAVTINKDGSFAYVGGKDDNIIRFITELSKNDAGRETLTSLINIATKVSIEITEDRGDASSAETEGQTIATNAFGNEKTITDPKTGEQVYEKAEITIYAGTHADEVKSGRGNYANSSLGKFINGIGTHEGRHVLNNLQAAKKSQEASKAAGLNGEDTRAVRKEAIEVIPNAEEKRANETYPPN